MQYDLLKSVNDAIAAVSFLKKPRTIQKEALAASAIDCMEQDQQHPITSLAVINQEGVVEGLIRLHDLLQSGL